MHRNAENFNEHEIYFEIRYNAMHSDFFSSRNMEKVIMEISKNIISNQA